MDRRNRPGPEQTTLEAVGDQLHYTLVVVQAGDDDDDDDDDDEPQQETVDAETFFVPVAFLSPKQQCQSTVS